MIGFAEFPWLQNRSLMAQAVMRIFLRFYTIGRENVLRYKKR